MVLLEPFAKISTFPLNDFKPLRVSVPLSVAAKYILVTDGSPLEKVIVTFFPTDSMVTESSLVGTVFVLQFLASYQSPLPPIRPIHDTSAFSTGIVLPSKRISAVSSSTFIFCNLSPLNSPPCNRLANISPSSPGVSILLILESKK